MGRSIGRHRRAKQPWLTACKLRSCQGDGSTSRRPRQTVHARQEGASHAAVCAAMMAARPLAIRHKPHQNAPRTSPKMAPTLLLAARVMCGRTRCTVARISTRGPLKAFSNEVQGAESVNGQLQASRATRALGACPICHSPVGCSVAALSAPHSVCVQSAGCRCAQPHGLQRARASAAAGACTNEQGYTSNGLWSEKSHCIGCTSCGKVYQQQERGQEPVQASK